MPLLASLGHELKAQNSVFGKEHVLFENIHAVDALFAQLLGQGVVAVEILLEGASHDGTEAVGRKGTGKDSNVAKGAFEGFIEDV